MTHRFLNSYNEQITEQQANSLDYYSVLFLENGTRIRKEIYFDGIKKQIEIYNPGVGNHTNLISPFIGEGFTFISVIEVLAYPNGYSLETHFSYANGTGTLKQLLNLLDGNQNIIATGVKDEFGQYIPDTVNKYYYDFSINPDEELFSAEFDLDSGLFEVIYNNNHLDEDGHLAIKLVNSTADIQKLMDLTGMSLAKATWYMNPEVIPNYEY